MIYLRLKELCHKKGTTPTALCRKITKSTGNLATWKNGNTKDEHLVEISKELEVPSDYLLGLTDETKPYPKSALLHNKETASEAIESPTEAIDTTTDGVVVAPESDSVTTPISNMKTSSTKAPFPKLMELPEDFTPTGAIPISPIEYAIPIVGVVRAGIGGAAHEDIEGYESVSKSELNGHDTSEYFWLRVKGDSMEPELFEGDLVLVHKQTSVDSGTLAVVLVDDIADSEGLVKIVHYGPDWIELVSNNENYPPRRFDKQEVLRIYVVGAVVQSKRIYSRVNRYKAKIFDKM